MTTRTVTGTVKHLDGTAWASASVLFELKDAFETSTEVFPVETHTETTDAQGQFSIALAVPDTGTAHYQVRLPDSSSFHFYLAAGVSVDLVTLITIAGTSVPQSDLQTLLDNKHDFTYVKTDTITEETTNAGVTVETILLKDSTITQTAVSAVNHRKLILSGNDANRRPMNENTFTVANAYGAEKNTTWQWGYNNDAGGFQEDISEAGWYLQMELNWVMDATSRYPMFEYHLNLCPTGTHVGYFRPFHIGAAKDGTWCEQKYVYDTINWNRRDTAASVMKLSIDKLELFGIGIIEGTNNVNVIRQLNVAGTTYRTLIKLDSSDIMQLAPALSGVNVAASDGTLGFYGVTPKARAVLATGTGKTVDNVITALQNLGLVKQS